MTEKELIKGCLHEDKSCQKEVFRLYAGKMLAVCRRYTRHYMEAEDIVQDAFIKVFDRIHQFKGQGSFEGWIRRIVIHTALKNYSKSSFQKELIGVENYNDQSISPKAVSELQQEDIMREISKLPDGYRLVFNLYVIEGYSHKEIAQFLKIEESTSRSQLTKARKMLQSRLLRIQQWEEARIA